MNRPQPATLVRRAYEVRDWPGESAGVRRGRDRQAERLRAEQQGTRFPATLLAFLLEMRSAAGTTRGRMAAERRHQAAITKTHGPWTLHAETEGCRVGVAPDDLPSAAGRRNTAFTAFWWSLRLRELRRAMCGEAYP